MNAYARYERGGVVPTIRKLSQLYAAVAKDRDLVLTENHAPTRFAKLSVKGPSRGKNTREGVVPREIQ